MMRYINFKYLVICQLYRLILKSHNLWLGGVIWLCMWCWAPPGHPWWHTAFSGTVRQSVQHQ